MDNINIQKKIQKLLALSSSNNPHEAQAAALKAQELMLQYNIEMLDAQNPDEVIIERYNFKEGENKHRRLTYHLLLASLIAENFRTKTYYGRDYICFVGYEQDAKASISILEFLITWIDRCFNLYLNSYKSTNPEYFESGAATYSKYLKRQWINGFLVGLQEAFEKRKAESRFELMLITPKAVLEKYNSLSLQNSNLHIKDEANNYDAFLNGKRTGEEALNNRSLENTKIGG